MLLEVSHPPFPSTLFSRELSMMLQPAQCGADKQGCLHSDTSCKGQSRRVRVFRRKSQNGRIPCVPHFSDCSLSTIALLDF